MRRALAAFAALITAGIMSAGLATAASASTVRPGHPAVPAAGCYAGVKWSQSGSKWQVDWTQDACGYAWRAEAYCYRGSSEWTGYGVTYSTPNHWSAVTCKSGFTWTEGLTQYRPQGGALYTVELAHR